ncbi:MAG: lysophospholipid acyltransferase family protein [Desulfosoma sp.]|uniref:lysophospholipid acyltransferase family protein n=1 Tax=Desulfosoma sp. TaxID=2603217 RepID=UPI00404B9EBE
MNSFQFAVWAMVRQPYRWFLAPQVSGLENVAKAAAKIKEENKGLLLVANHISAWDPMFICAVLEWNLLRDLGSVIFLGKRELFDRPWKRWLMKHLGCVNIRERAVVRGVIQGLRQGNVYFLFPEGCVSCDGRMGQDLGAVRFFAKHCSFVVLPIRLHGIWGGFRKDWRNIVAGRRRLRVAFGRPILVEKGYHEHLDAMALIRDVASGPASTPQWVPSWATP